MPRFIYLAPPDEPSLMGTVHAATGEWLRGVPRDIDAPAHVAWLRRHPHWREVAADADADGDGAESVDELRAALDAKGVEYDRRLGAKRLRELLDAAG